jgi:hypothetical protein
MHQSTIFRLYTSIITVLLIRQAEDDNRGENLEFLNEKWFNSYDLKDEELTQINDTICVNIRDDLFDEKG